ncbi:helix-turn-helix domain-containing protein [Anaerovorax odorimutans]|uniref:Helix-turn-helix domain-containing protein n=1 Tax=Anaerovorax odorimutans TaxID=109327 RepID=A0ABT1RPP1_9FIRM|nr:helix-turn-helix transcriptional regulator [Anaerovorax odorimutans]MCQ4637161.1 helix-turn-helix domain-containing protein [Anaerovorax odorimutans]
MTLQKNLATIMNAIRDTRDQTLTEFAKELDISRSSLQKILDGKGNPRIDTVEHLARHLDMEPLSLLSCSYMEEQLHVAIPLLQIGDEILKLPKDKRLQFVELFHKIMLLLADSDTDASGRPDDSSFVE